MTNCCSCNEELEPAWKKCPACGTPVASPLECPRCGEAIKPHWRACPECEIELTPAAGAAAAPSAAAWSGGPSQATPTGSNLMPPPAFASPFVSVAGGGAPTPPSSPRGSGGAGTAGVEGFPAPEIPPTTRLGKYAIGGLLGRGGFGAVYAARDTVTGELVALKAIPTFREEGPLVADLTREYRAQRAITRREHVLEMQSPELAQAAGLTWVYVPMEKAEKSLRDWLEETRDDLEGRLDQGLEYLRQACRGVAALHEAGILHLDLKPENLLLVRDEKAEEEAKKAARREKRPDPSPVFRVKVADFGLARNVRRLGEANPALLRDGVGTPAYMAPEQVFAARAKDVTVAADVYALGIVLFELLDGDVPFEGTPEDVRRKQREATPAALAEEVPGHLRALVSKLLSKDPAARPASAAELEALLAGGAVREVEAPAAPKAARPSYEAVRRAGYRVVEPGEEWYPKKLHPEAESLAARLGIPVVIEHEKSGVVLALIPGGSYRMGASEGDDDAADDEKPAHDVRIRQFYVGVAPVLQEQWEKVTGENPSEFKGPKRPVENVSWDDCQALLKKANEGRPGPGLRLPSEAEWEYSARAGTSTRYWWGDEYQKGMANCNELGINGKYEEKTTVVGSYPLSPWGLVDVIGNVWEWCQDDYGGEYGKMPSDGSAFKIDGERSRRFRGGSWTDWPSYLFAYSRSGLRAGGRHNALGCRFVRDAVFP